MCRKKRTVYKAIGLLVVLLVQFMATGVAEGHKADAGGQWRYALEGAGVTITGYEVEPKGHVVIPGELDGHPVTGIGEDAFADCSDMTGVTIPDSVTGIADWAFPRCGSLTSVAIPASVTSIGDLAFYGCMSLTYVTIPDSVTSIGNNPFVGCPLEGVDVSPDNPAYAQLDGVLFDKQRETLIAYPGGRKGGYVIPYGVTSIGDWAFTYCDFLTDLIVPDSVTSLGVSAFEGCKSLVWVTLPNTITRISAGAFSGCRSLTGIALPTGLTSIGDYAFDSCESLTHVIVPDGVTSIGGWAFEGCARLISITIPSSVTSIGTEAFFGCERLALDAEEGSFAEGYAKENGIRDALTASDTPIAVEDDEEERTDASGQWVFMIKDGGANLWGYKEEPTGELTIPDKLDGYPVTAISDEALWCDKVTSITIPASVTTIGNYVFMYCSGLTSIDVSPDNPAYAQIGGVLFDKSGQTLIAYPVAREGAYVIPEGVLSIGKNAFAECAGLTEATIPDSVTSLGDYAFGNAKALTKATIGSGVTEISFEAFYECSQLTKVTLPDSVTGIGGYAFYKCGSLPELTLPSGVTSIGDYAFHMCSALSRVNIPQGVTSIGEKAFWQCSALTGVAIPGSVTSIGYGAFAECESLASATIAEGLPGISAYAFYKCHSLSSLDIPASVTSIGSGAFYECSALTSLMIPEGVTEIADRVLAECSGITSVTLPEGATSIGEYAFHYCTGLTDVTIPASVTSIGEEAFSGCEALTLRVARDSVGEQYAKGSRMPYVFIGNADTGKGEADKAVLERGAQLMEAQDYVGALAHFDAAIAENVGVAEYHARRADALARLDRSAEAELAYARAVQIEPDNARYWDEYGGILMFLSGKYQEAYEAIGKAVTLEPMNGEFISDHGIALFYMDRQDEALAELERGIELAPEYPRAYDFAAFIQYKRGALDEAVLLCEKGLAVMPEYEALYLTLGDAKFGLGHYAEAIEAYDQAFSSGTFSSDDVDSYGPAKRALVEEKAAEGLTGDIEEITVSSAEELLSALGSNRRILLEEGVYNLTSAEPGFVGNENVYLEECFEGYELILDGVHNLTLQGAGDGRSEIVVESRYASVARFLGCTNIRIEGITAGHTKGGVCEGGVFAFDYCAGITVEDTEMYGCGTMGLELYWSANIEVIGSTIYECTDGAMYMRGCSNASFQNCVFKENTGDMMVYVEVTSNVTFDSCSFLYNAGEEAMFSIVESENLVARNTEFIGNDVWELVYQDHDEMELDASNRFENNAFDDQEGC